MRLRLSRFDLRCHGFYDEEAAVVAASPLDTVSHQAV
jgi:hypothetical protein